MKALSYFTWIDHRNTSFTSGRPRDNKTMHAKPDLRVSHRLGIERAGGDFNQQDPAPSTFVLLLRGTKGGEDWLAVVEKFAMFINLS